MSWVLFVQILILMFMAGVVGSWLIVTWGNQKKERFLEDVLRPSEKGRGFDGRS